MSFIEHSIRWADGEQLEAALTAMSGVSLASIAVAFWFLGQTPHARAMLIPLLAVGGLLTFAGSFGYASNRDAAARYERAYSKDPVAFLDAEQERVEDFESLYTFTLVLAISCFITAIAMFWLSSNPHVRAVGIALSVVGVAGLVIDNFAKERADIYYEKILEEQVRSRPGA